MSKCRGGAEGNNGDGLRIVTLDDFQSKKKLKDGTQKKKK